MQILINGQKHSFQKSPTISEVLAMLQISREHSVAVARNYAVISRSMLEDTYLDDGDTLDIISAAAGG